MSQPHNPTDPQALVQSMLQRLKLQPGREGQAHLHSPAPVTTAESGASNLQKVSNDFKFGTNGIPSKEFGNSAADSKFGFKGGKIQQPDHGSEVDRGLISFHSQKDNTDGEDRVGQATQPGITPTGTGQLFPTKSLKDADITSFERTDGERVSFGSSATTAQTPQNTDTVSSIGQNQKPDQGFTPRVYAWSLKRTDSGSEENQVVHMGNGGSAGLTQDAQAVLSSQNTTNSDSRRKQRSSENKTRRWTQKIKERWRDRPGSFGKKGKEEGGTAGQENGQSTEISSPNQASTAENLINTSNKDGERSLSSMDSSGPSRTEDSTDAHVRSTSDFDFGLGSFSLLEEIVMGQEWAKFLNPNLSAPSANHTPSEQPLSQAKIQPNPQDSNQSPGFLNQFRGGSNRWSFRNTESSPAPVFSRTQTSPEAFSPVSMDVSEGRQQQQQQWAHREADHSEPMEDGHNQSDMQSGGSGPQQPRTPSFTQPAENLHNSASKSRVPSNRKRQHQSAERQEGQGLQTDKTRDREMADRGGSMSSVSPTSSHMMNEAGPSQHNDIIPLYSLNSPSFPKPVAPAPRGVLKHSISQDLEPSMETVTKRRRVEENRRVRFLEEVVTIEPPDLDLDATDSEEDSGAEEDSVTEQECDVEPAAMEEVAPARRPALPAWIRALKRKNTGRKHRQ
ncbi:dentin sialophosphoprotein [Stegastes partitus]|uniref:Dentin sialophosphoprotein n=1 Tax=Stegastes partitus TaxID=144197 RepID=A0A9Y4JSS3_9TELE|nr:PREDICTED: dentin sialophosphoprotein-like [Stegastes partitus]